MPTQPKSVKASSRNKRITTVALFEGIHQCGIEILKQAGFEVIANVNAATPQQLVKVQREADLIGIRSRTNLKEDFFASCDRLEAVGCFCIGTNQVDLGSACQKGVAVFNAPHSNTRSVAELVLGEVIMLMRRIPITNRAMHNGQWHKNAESRHEIRGKTLGIVGYGNIGSQLSVLAESLGMRVVFYDISNKLALGNAQPVKTLRQLLSQSDAISLHVPEDRATHLMMNAERLHQCKKGAILINAARGTVVDINALCSALTSGHIAGAALDVFPEEPAGKEGMFNSPLSGKENVILTSHIGGSTVEAQAAIGEEVAQKLINYHLYGSSSSSVNLPRISLDAPEIIRILHLHRNVPGVMGSINQIIAKHNINISGSHLNTLGELGYASIDVNIKHRTELAEMCKELESLPDTIRVKVVGNGSI